MSVECVIDGPFITIRAKDGYYPPVGIDVEFQLYDETLLIGVTAVLYHGDARNQVETVFVPDMSTVFPEMCKVYCAEAVHSWRQVRRCPAKGWNLITKMPVPKNRRLYVFDVVTDESAMAWLDQIDSKWYYSPQGGLLPFTPTHWRNVHDSPAI